MIQTVISDGHRKWNELHSRLFDEVLRDIRSFLWQKWQFSAIAFNGSFDLSHLSIFLITFSLTMDNRFWFLPF